LQRVELGRSGSRRHVVPADWWQAAEPLGDYAYVGATVGPGFDFADFSFGRDDPAVPNAAAAGTRTAAPAVGRISRPA
jgi:predicted cupin superfamily sugar epimerase